MSISVDELYQKLLDSGISEVELEKQVKSKESEFGGFMSKQGILFIIAKENGIYIQSPEIGDYIYKEFEEDIDYDEFTINLSDLKEDMRNIVLLGKVLQIYESREFVRKDGTLGKVASFSFGDATQKLKVILWDDKVDLIKKEFFQVGELVRVIGAYCKKGRNNNLEIHVGKRGTIIFSPEVANKKIKARLNNVKIIAPSRQNVEKKSSLKIKDLVERFNYIKKVQGQIYIEVFKEITKKSGEKTFLLKLLLSDESTTIQVTIWGMNAVECLKIINDYDSVVISNVSVKENNYTNEKELVFTKNSTLKVV
jgi:ssDNA-binding replication factor A large subunit